MENRDHWIKVYKNAKPKEIIRIPLIKDNYKLDNFLADINDLFLLIATTDTEILLRKIMYPHEYTSAKELSAALNAMLPLNSLFAENVDQASKGFMCQLTKSVGAKEIGSGLQGRVYYVESWRSDVVIKIISIEQYPLNINNSRFGMFKDPIDGIYKVDYGLLEILASALMNEYVNSTSSDSSYMLFVPRMMGFISCPELHIITENLNQGRLDKFISRRSTNRKLIKTMLFHALFTIIALNRLGYMHLDSSLKNFLLREINKNEMYRNQNLYTAKTWKLILDEKEWNITNFKWITKITDFGFMIKTSPFPLEQKFSPPYIIVDDNSLKTISENYYISNEYRLSYDISYFFVSLEDAISSNLKNIFYNNDNLSWYDEYSILFRDFAKLANIDLDIYKGVTFSEDPKLKLHPMRAIMNKKYINNNTGRPEASIRNFDPIEILNSSFFDEIMQK